MERAAVYSLDGSRISRSTSIDILLQSDFKIVINDQSYTVRVPEEGELVIYLLAAINSQAKGHLHDVIQVIHTQKGSPVLEWN